MAAEHLRALIGAEVPHCSVRELETSAGVPEGRLAYLLKPGTVLRRMPTMERIHEIAHIIGCPTERVYRALRADVDGEALLEDLPEDERALLAAYRRLGELDRLRLVRIAGVLYGQ